MQQRTRQPNGRRAVVVIGGDALHPSVAARLPADAVVFAADSGFDHATAAGLRPDVLLGDLDSISVIGLEAARSSGVRIETFPADKDATDTELALDHALAAVGPGGSIVLAGGGGDRLDHLLASLHALALPRLSQCAELSAWVGPAHVHVLHAPRRIELGVLGPDVVVSLVPLGDVGGVTTLGLRWPLADEPLTSGTSRGVSNLTTGGTAAVEARSGVLAVVIPQAADLTAGAAPPEELP